MLAKLVGLCSTATRATYRTWTRYSWHNISKIRKKLPAYYWHWAKRSIARKTERRGREREADRRARHARQYGRSILISMQIKPVYGKLEALFIMYFSQTGNWHTTHILYMRRSVCISIRTYSITTYDEDFLFVFLPRWVNKCANSL